MTKALVLGLGFLVAGFVQAEPLHLEYNSNSHSVAALVNSALRTYAQKHGERGGVRLGCSELLDSHHSFLIEDEGARLESADRNAPGMIQLQVYALSVSQSELAWTSSSRSVPAVLWDALYEEHQSYLPNPSPIKAPDFDTLVIEDEAIRLTCQAKTLGTAMVMSYRCAFAKLKPAAK